jgi:hypothetical protein
MDIPGVLPATLDQIMAVLVSWGQKIGSPLYQVAYATVVKSAILDLFWCFLLLVVITVCVVGAIKFYKLLSKELAKEYYSQDDDVKSFAQVMLIIFIVFGMMAAFVLVPVLSDALSNLITPEWNALKLISELLISAPK